MNTICIREYLNILIKVFIFFLFLEHHAQITKRITFVFLDQTEKERKRSGFKVRKKKVCTYTNSF